MEHNKHKDSKKTLIVLYSAAAVLVVAIILAGTYLLNSIDEFTNVVDAPDTQTETAFSELSPEEQEELYSLYNEFSGRWEGTWSNETFSNSGEVVVEVEVNDDGTVRAVGDLDGYVFGISDPEPRELLGTYSTAGVTFALNSDSFFGDVQVILNRDQTITVQGVQIPFSRVFMVTGEGLFDKEKASIGYTVNWIGDTATTGTVQLEKVQE